MKQNLRFGEPAHLTAGLNRKFTANTRHLTRIGLISDTHGFLDDAVFTHFREVDEIWHAGDFGPAAIADALSSYRPLRGVYGNIDGNDIRSSYREQLVFPCEEITVMMRHIGGVPPRYNPVTLRELRTHRPTLFIAGHSHLLKIQYDERLACLYMNPGAAGRHGWHKVRTLIRFTVDGTEIRDCEVIELLPR